ncbi:hypothetical protein PML95_09955 (plasmid) [Vagococcus lutrae]|uniref:Uncharacterized protein n=1 Tax=Vagococcus lutrae TaxID=81947 RepID=A0AAE9XGE0_9ENTE|nr:hypothetical protein [Vagococcus lutrae]MCO7151732.1 hypothetical protein [Vagococcus lutrae]WCG23687.1 hypothetical protein PML95_09955 [Vagococcus lutrae]
MRTVIQGKELTITLKTDRELTTQEIVMAHQLATGNFEALFVRDEADEKKSEQLEQQEPDKYSFEEKKNELKDTAYLFKGDKVKVDINCPTCNFKGIRNSTWGNTFSKCPNCKEKLYNSFATGVPAIEDENGCVYHANSLMQFKHDKEVYEKMFLTESEEETDD